MSVDIQRLDATVLRFLHACKKTYHPRFDTLPSVPCFDEFKSMKSCSGKMSFVFMNRQTQQLISVLGGRRLAFLKLHLLKFTRKRTSEREIRRDGYEYTTF